MYGLKLVENVLNSTCMLASWHWWPGPVCSEMTLSLASRGLEHCRISGRLNCFEVQMGWFQVVNIFSRIVPLWNCLSLRRSFRVVMFEMNFFGFGSLAWCDIFVLLWLYEVWPTLVGILTICYQRWVSATAVCRISNPICLTGLKQLFSGSPQYLNRTRIQGCKTSVNLCKKIMLYFISHWSKLNCVKQCNVGKWSLQLSELLPGLGTGTILFHFQITQIIHDYDPMTLKMVTIWQRYFEWIPPIQCSQRFLSG